MKIRVRPAKDRDLGLFSRLWQEYLTEAYEQGSGVPPSDTNMEFYREVFKLYVSGEEKGVILFVGECAVLMLGTAGTLKIVSDRDPIAQGWGVYVQPDHQGQGISTALYTEAHKQLKEIGFKTVGGHCNLDQPGAWGSLDKVGYEKLQYVVVKDLSKE